MTQMKKLLNSTMTLALGFLFLQTGAMADQKKPEKGMMDEQMMKLGQPGEAHKRLEPLVGKWEYTVTWWMNPGKEPQVMKGTNENTLVMGGRFLQQQAHGETKENQPTFEGMGLTGYDNIKKSYTSMWVDN